MDTYGNDSVGWYVGNQIAFNYSAFFWITGFMAAIRSPHLYTAASVDINNRWAASAATRHSASRPPIALIFLRPWLLSPSLSACAALPLGMGAHEIAEHFFKDIGEPAAETAAPASAGAGSSC